MQFFATEALGPTQSLTPEGYLVCQSVPIARLGMQEYAPGELDNEIAPDSRGIVCIERVADEVFRPESIASFNGKPVIMTSHQMLDARSWKTRIVGVVMNARRGDDTLSDRLVADLMIYDEIAATAIRNGQREVSCGYYADYEETRPGHGRQVNIIGNHLALVERGRCGPACAIGDSDMPATVQKKVSQKPRWLDRLRAAITLGDQEKIDEVMSEVPAEGGEGSGGFTFNLNMGGETKPTIDAEREGGEGSEGTAPTLADVMAAIAALGERVGKLETLEAKEIAEQQTGDEETDEEKAARMAKEEDERKEKEGATGDSSALVDVFQTARTGAEILAPGISLPVFDAKARPGATIDAICSLRRDALKRFGDSADGKIAMEKLGLATLDIAQAHCDAIATGFSVAVSAKRSIPANAGQITFPKGATHDGYKPKTNAEINAANRARYGFPVLG